MVIEVEMDEYQELVPRLQNYLKKMVILLIQNLTTYILLSVKKFYYRKEKGLQNYNLRKFNLYILIN